MNLKSMVIEKEDGEESCEPCMTKPSDGPRYPYGLCLRLDNDVLEKLGLTSMPAVGSKVMIEAVCEVNSVSQHDSKDGGKNKSLSLQITDMGVAKQAKGVKSQDFYSEE